MSIDQTLRFIDQMGGSYGKHTPNGSVPLAVIGANAIELKRLGLVEDVVNITGEVMVALSGAGRVYVRDKL